jgi:hypothetical protein
VASADVLQGRSPLRLVLETDAWVDVEAARAWVAEAQAARDRGASAEAFARA